MPHACKGPGRYRLGSARRLWRAGGILAMAVASVGCAQFENRVACSVSGQDAFYVSEYMRLGIASQIKAADAKAICKAPA